MASSPCSATLASTSLSSSPIFTVKKPEFSNTHIVICSKKPFVALRSGKWSSRASFFSGFVPKVKDIESLKQELLAAIQPLDRGAEGTTEDQQRIDEIAREMEEQNKIKKPLNSNLLNGKWELLYTTSQSVLKTQRPKFLRPNGKIYQAINVYTLRAQNMETWPFFNQATANLVPLNSRRVAVKFDFFKICDTDKKSGKWSRAAGNHLLGRRTTDFERRSRQLVYSEDGGSIVQSSSLTRRRGAAKLSVTELFDGVSGAESLNENELDIAHAIDAFLVYLIR